jgi:serine/threonine protein phosphatase PrpC
MSLNTCTDKNLKRRQSFDNKDEVSDGNAGADCKASLNGQGIGLVCKKGLKPESPNQDSYSLLKTETFTLYGVFDGHGPNGHDVSNFVVKHLFMIFLKCENHLTQPEAALKYAFETIQESLGAESTINAEMSGSTCTVVFQPLDRKEITVAHVGDSRAIMMLRGGACQDLTEDHKPNLPGEKERIEKAGGRVVFDGYFNHRVFTRDGRGGLNMSRALGDTVAHKAGVTATPETKTVQLTGKEEALIICTDGVWEFIESEEAVKLVHKYPRDKVQSAAEELAKQSWDKWIEDSDGEVSDDITAIISFFG